MLYPTEIDFGSIDAVNYQAKSKKQLLSNIFYRDKNLDRLLEENRYFLIGEKGTGKTAYAVFLSNTEYQNTAGSVFPTLETDYRKFISMKNSGQLDISDITDAWSVILLLLLSSHLKSTESRSVVNFRKFADLDQAIETYYDHAFSPEISSALKFVENSKSVNGVFSRWFRSQEQESDTTETATSGSSTNLHKIEQYFRSALSTLKLTKSHIVFIDGIDIRPSNINYNDYMECVGGLCQAAWNLNTTFFSCIKDSPGRLKIVLLLRPDIFHNVGFQNPNAKARDNSVLLDWRTTYKEYKTSKIFRMTDKILREQQEEKLPDGKTWEYYFPFDLTHGVIAEQRDDPFIGILRQSFYRPRDIIQYIILMQEHIEQHEPDNRTFSSNSFFRVQQSYSDYLLGEVRDELMFYYSSVDFDELTGFFTFFEGRSRFDWPFFVEKYKRFYESQNDPNLLTLPAIKKGPRELLQFLYSLNVIGYIERNEDTFFVHYCFRDRSQVVLNPKVQYDREYMVHQGLVRALKLGTPT